MEKVQNMAAGRMMGIEGVPERHVPGAYAWFYEERPPRNPCPLMGAQPCTCVFCADHVRSPEVDRERLIQLQSD